MWLNLLEQQPLHENPSLWDHGVLAKMPGGAGNNLTLSVGHGLIHEMAMPLPQATVINGG